MCARTRASSVTATSASSAVCVVARARAPPPSLTVRKRELFLHATGRRHVRDPTSEGMRRASAHARAPSPGRRLQEPLLKMTFQTLLHELAEGLLWFWGCCFFTSPAASGRGDPAEAGMPGFQTAAPWLQRHGYSASRDAR